MGGVQGSFSLTGAFNPRTGEQRAMGAYAISFTGGTPEGFSISGGGASLGTAETSDMGNLLGSSEVWGVNVSADAIAQLGIAYEQSTSTIGVGDLRHTIDPVTGKEITTRSIGIVFGADSMPNIIDAGGSYSPALNYSDSLWRTNIYPWNW
jgi:hypothetical protein